MGDRGEDSRQLSSDFYNEVNDTNENVVDDDCDVPLMPTRLYNNIYHERQFSHGWLYGLIFLSFGVVGTVPWNFFINANEFWEYKFRDVNQSDPVDPTRRTDLQSKFESFLSVAAMVPSLIGAMACILLSSRFRAHYRMLVPMIVVFILFTAVTFMSLSNTDSWQLLFLLLTLASVAVLNCFMSYGQCSTMGFAGTISPKYMNAMMSGQAVGGVIASVARIATALFKGSITQSSSYYFIFALSVIFATILTFLLLSRTVFYKFHIQKIEDSKLLVNEESIHGRLSIWTIVLRMRLYVFSIVIVFITTLAIFPSIATLVVSVDRHSASTWTGKLFIPVACFLLFNVGDLCGRSMANWVTLIPERNISLLIVSIVRMSLIPLLMLCNAQPRHLLPVVFDSDWIFILLIAIFAITNGYLATLCMMYAPKIFTTVGDQEMASVLMSLFMSTGIAAGAIASTFLVVLL